jgi:hypothetical protein
VTHLRALFEIADADALRGLLDQLNDAGADDKAAGIDALGQPFLVALTGPYAESERVILFDPSDTAYDQAPYCDECGQATRRLGLADLHYPVTVIR